MKRVRTLIYEYLDKQYVIKDKEHVIFDAPLSQIEEEVNDMFGVNGDYILEWVKARTKRAFSISEIYTYVNLNVKYETDWLGDKLVESRLYEKNTMYQTIYFGDQTFDKNYQLQGGKWVEW